MISSSEVEGEGALKSGFWGVFFVLAVGDPLGDRAAGLRVGVGSILQIKSH